MPKRTPKFKTQFEINALKGKAFSVGGIKGFWCDYRKGNPTFYLRYTIKQERLEYCIGTINLKAATKEARRLRALIDEGQDPKEIKRAEEAQKKADQEALEKKESKAKNTLRKITGLYFDWWIPLFCHAKDGGKRDVSRFNKVLKVFGDFPIDDITSNMLFDYFKGFWAEKGSKGDKELTRLKNIYEWAIQNGYTEHNPTMEGISLREKLKPYTKARKKPNTQPAPDYREIPKLLKQCLSNLPLSMSAKAFIFQVLTGLRSEAVVSLAWSDIDLDKALAIIKPENDKASKEFNTPNRPREVYLSTQSISLLKSIPKIGEYVFIARGRLSGHIGSAALLQYLIGIHQQKKDIDGVGWIDVNNLDKNAGKPRHVVPHGTSRASMRTWAEETGKSDKVAELCIFHNFQDKYKGAYRRGQFEKERRQFMQEWADFCLKGIDLKSIL